MTALDSPRWCAVEQSYGDHHTDRCYLKREEASYRDDAFMEGTGWTMRDGRLFNSGFEAGLRHYRVFPMYAVGKMLKLEVAARDEAYAKIKLPGEDKCEDQFARGWMAARNYYDEQEFS